MNRRPGQVKVSTEVAYCSFCGRPRTLRREEHQLGTLVRTIVTCETCHRTLSSSMGVAAAEPEPAGAEPAAEPVAAAPAAAETEKKPARKRPAAKSPAKKRAPAATAKPAGRRSASKK